jgi:hypothetical protein
LKAKLKQGHHTIEGERRKDKAGVPHNERQKKNRDERQKK